MAELETFGAALRAARKRKGLSVRQLAEAIGLSPPYLVDIELSRRKPFPPGDVYEKLSKAVGGKPGEWLAAGVSERVCSALDDAQLPDHIRNLVHVICLHAHTITGEQSRRARHAILPAAGV